MNSYGTLYIHIVVYKFKCMVLYNSHGSYFINSHGTDGSHFTWHFAVSIDSGLAICINMYTVHSVCPINTIASPHMAIHDHI